MEEHVITIRHKHSCFHVVHTPAASLVNKGESRVDVHASLTSTIAHKDASLIH